MQRPIADRDSVTFFAETGMCSFEVIGAPKPADFV
jgi:hypothetical protein